MPKTADSNLVSVRAIRETTFGTTPSTPAMQVVRIRSSDLSPDKQTEVDPTLRGDRMIQSLVRQAIGARGALPMSFAYGADFEMFLQGLMGALIVSKKATGTFTIDKTGAAAGKAHINRVSGSFLTPFTVDDEGAYCRLWGFEPAASNDVFEIETITGLQMIVNDPNNVLVNDATGEGNEQVDIRYVRNGLNRYGFSIEEDITFTDATHAFLQGKGLVVERFGLVVENGRIMTCEFSFNGVDVVGSASAFAGETLNGAPGTLPMSASGEVKAVRQDGADTSVLARLELNVQTGVRRKMAVGSISPIDVGIGRFNPSGRIRQYFESLTQFNKFRNHDAARIDLICKDLAATPNIAVFTIPQFRYGEGRITKEGIDTDVFFDAPFQSELYEDPAGQHSDFMFQVSLFPNAPLP